MIKLRIYLLGLFTFFWILNSTEAQEFLLEEVSDSTKLESIIRSAPFISINENSKHLSVVPIRINSLWELQDQERLSFIVPGTEIVIEAIATRPRRYSNFYYEWSGDILGDADEIVGYLNIVRNGNQKFGSIVVGSRKFFITDLNLPFEDDQVLVEVFIDESEGSGCVTYGITENPNDDPGPIFDEPNPQEGPSGGGASCEVAKIKVLVLYTQEVMDGEYNISEVAQLGKVYTNLALHESSIDDVTVSIEIAGPVLLEGYIEVGNADDALQNLSENPNISQLRTDYYADLVILFQDTELFTSRIVDGQVIINTDIAGYANINDIDVDNPDDFPHEEQVFSVIEASAPSDIFAHEVGHLLGCRHRKEDDPHAFANAYEICVQSVEVNGEVICNEYRSTIMDGRSHVVRIPRFSNPNGDFMGVPTGTDFHHNARMIAATACYISNFRSPPFSAFASGPTNIYHDEERSFLYSSYYWGCLDGEVSYHWEVSWDGQSTYQDLSDSPFEEDVLLSGSEIPFNNGSNVSTVKIRFTSMCSATGGVNVQIIDVNNWSSQELVVSGDRLILNDTRSENSKLVNNNEENLSLFAYPNPAKSILYIDFSSKALTRRGNIELSLVSSDGVGYYVKYELIDDKSIVLNLEGIPSGYYILQAECSGERYYEPLIIQK